MAPMRTRIIASAVVFAANMALSRSYGAAEEHLPRPGAIRMSHQHHAIFSVFMAAETATMTMMPDTSMHSSEYSSFCVFTGVSGC